MTLFSCGHVVPPENLTAIVLPSGPMNCEFDFTANVRGDDALIEELGRVVVNLCSVVPFGMILFFPSYRYGLRERM